MPYSFTEKKRIRKSFAKRPAVHAVPFLLATQLESYMQFLQAEVAPSQRKPEGLQAAFLSIFPISSHNGMARLEFGGFNLGEGLAGFLGLALQLALVAGIAMLVLRFIRSRREAAAQPAAAYAGAGSAAGMGGATPVPDVMARSQTSPEYRPALGQGGGSTDAVAPQSGDDIGLLATDFDAFETRLADVQAAWSKGDLAALRRLATPEMVGYLSEDLSANSSRGVENRVEEVKLEQGDLSEAWQEGSVQYAAVAMRFSALDYDASLSDGRVVAGSREARREHTEVWTFMRSQGGDWILSAIQQV